MPQPKNNLLLTTDPLSASNSFNDYNLKKLQEDHGYRRIAAFNSFESLIDSLELPPPQANKVTIIGINGPTCAGKTTFSQLLAEQLSRKLPSTELSFEWFLYDRDIRAKMIDDITKGLKTIPEVTAAAWDVDRYVSTLKKLKSMDSKTNGRKLKLNNLYDRTSGKQQAKATLSIPYGGYLIVEGVSVIDIPEPNLADCYIRLDVDEDLRLMERIIAREKSKPRAKQLSEEFLRRRFGAVDLDHMRYLRSISRSHNKYIINTTKFDRLEVFSNAKLS